MRYLEEEIVAIAKQAVADKDRATIESCIGDLEMDLSDAESEVWAMEELVSDLEKALDGLPEEEVE